jgi:hypothetical protein
MRQEVHPVPVPAKREVIPVVYKAITHIPYHSIREWALPALPKALKAATGAKGASRSPLPSQVRAASLAFSA